TRPRRADAGAHGAVVRRAAAFRSRPLRAAQSERDRGDRAAPAGDVVAGLPGAVVRAAAWHSARPAGGGQGGTPNRPGGDGHGTCRAVVAGFLARAGTDLGDRRKTALAADRRLGVAGAGSDRL